MADRARIFRSSTFRLALTYLAIFAASAASLLGGVYWTSSAFIDRQIRETINAEIAGLSDRYRAQGIGGLVRVISERGNAEFGRKSLYLLADGRYRRLVGNLAAWPAAEPDAEGWVEFAVQPTDADAALVYQATGRVFDLAGDYHLLVGRSLQDAAEAKGALRRAITLGLAFTMLLGVGGGLLMSRQMLQRVEGINKAMRSIIDGDMSQRVRQRGTGDEFDQLAEGFNRMVDEIERLVDGIRAVTDNVAHDLRTPLHRLRSRIEIALLAEGDPEGCRRVLEETMADADRLLATFNALLTIAHAESGSRVNRFETVDLAALARDAFELYEPLSEEKGVALSLEAGEPRPVQGDRHLLAQAMINLLDNALKYTPAGGAVAVRVTDGPEVVVADSGPGIPPEDRERVLERFVRLDATRSTPGNGLGLSLVSAVARLHGARILLDDNRPGLKVRMVFSG